MGNSIGEKDTNSTKQIIYHAGLLAIVLTIALTILGLVVSPFLMQMLEAKGEYLNEALSYINIVLYGSVFYVGVFFINAMLNSIGNTKAFRNFLVMGFFLNIVLDFWFVKGGLGIAPLGIKGIGYATIIVECVGMVYLFMNLKNSYLLKNMPEFKFDMQIIYDMLTQGVPPTINMSLMALGMFIITYFIAPFGQHVVASYGIAIRIEQIILLPSIGINVAVLSLVSQNNGAKLYERVKETVMYAQKIGFVMWIIGIVFLLLLGEFFMGLFTSDAQVIQAGLIYLHAAAVSLYAYMLVFINIALLQGIKQPALLIYLSLFRQLIIPGIVFSIFAFYKLSLAFYWWGLVGIIWSSALFIVWYARGKVIIYLTND